VSSRSQESSRSQRFGPPAGYQPILLPGESISKYRGLTTAPPTQDQRDQADAAEARSSSHAASTESAAQLTGGFPDDEPIFAASTAQSEAESGHEENTRASSSESSEINVNARASTSVDWNQDFTRSETMASRSFDEEHGLGRTPEREFISEAVSSQASESPVQAETSAAAVAPAFAAPGTLEEETIEEDEADTLRYQETSDEGFEEFEEETRAASQGSQSGSGEVSEVRETVTEIHMASLAESGVEPAETATADSDDDSEELELEEAQAEAEAMLDAEARGNGTVDARAEVRAPATAAYAQRAPRPRPSYERRGGGRRGGRRFPRREAREIPKISDLLKEGQEILVQIAKEPIGKKGARITSHIALPGRFLVYMPTVNHTGVSRKIASDEERQRLKRIVMSERENGHGGFIVRTAAQNASEDELRADIRFLKGLWNDIKTRAENSKPPALIYHDLNVVERVLRDQVTSDFSVIWVDTEQEYERILRFFNRFQPGLVKRVKLYTKETPLFEQFGLAEEMNKALKSKVWLKSGGYIVINQTEALVAIDINTGKYVGKTSRLEDTIVKTNVDAIKEIVRQIRLRDLGGIIIIDFIDMDERRNRQRVMQALEEELRHDRAPSKVLQFNDFGLVAITRKRVKQSLERTIGAPCPYCQSTGYVKSLTTICNEIYVEMRKIAKHLEHEDVMLRVNPEVAKELKASNGRLLNEMEELTKRTIIVKSDPALHQEQFDIN
jgi:Rne/Rng family ribonuclease